MRSVLLLYRKNNFSFQTQKAFSLFNRLIFLENSLNKLTALEVKELLCPEISSIGPLPLHARNKRFSGAKFNFKYSGKFLLCRA